MNLEDLNCWIITIIIILLSGAFLWGLISLVMETKRKSKKMERLKKLEKLTEQSEEGDLPKETFISTSMRAKQAISYIDSTPLNKLEGFITPEESRKTVINAWERKQNLK